MYVYTFRFDPRYAGQSATITTSTGASAGVDPVTLDSTGAGSISTAFAGNYVATVSNASQGLGNSTSVLYYDQQASIAATGGLEAEGTFVEFEIADPFDVDSGAAGAIDLSTFSLLPDGVTEDNGTLSGLEPGYYLLNLQTHYTRPAAQYVAQFVITDAGSGDTFYFPAATIWPDGVKTRSGNDYQTALVHVSAAGSVRFTIQSDCVDGTASPDPLEVSYFYMSGYRIG